MLWLFVILGLLVFIGSAFGFVSTWRGKSRLSALHFAALFFVAVAWVIGHGSRGGWVAVLVASLLELVAWARVSISASQAEEVPSVIEFPSKQDAIPDGDGHGKPDPPRISVSPPATLESLCLLPAAWRGSADVFLASLRRGGQRDAMLVGDDPPTYRIGEIELVLTVERRPVAPATIEFALSQTFDWPGAADAVSSHVAHVRVVTRAACSIGRREIIRLHVRAYLALLEFAPALAMLWPKAGRLVSSEALRAERVERIDVVSLCVSFRSFAVDKDVLCDTVGLHALDLRDMEIVLPTEPDDAVSAILYEKATAQIETGVALDSTELEVDENRRFPGTVARSALPPDREVIHWETEKKDSEEHVS